MLRRSISIFLILAILIVPFSNVYAAQIDATIFAQTDEGFGELNAKQTLIIEYEDSKSRALFEGMNKNIEFTVDSSEDIKALLNIMNQNLRELNSPATFSDAKLHYAATISGDKSSAFIAIKIIIDFSINNLVVSGDPITGLKSDLNWRGLKVDGPVIINAPGIGAMNINNMKGLLEKTYPEIMNVLSHEAGDLLTIPILDFSGVKELPMANWHSSFDATGAVKEAEKYKLVGDIPPVITILAKGESSFREGILREIEIEREININGEHVKLTLTMPGALASIRLAGYAVTEVSGTNEYAVVTNNPPVGKQVYASQNLPIIVVAVFAAMAAVIAGAVIWKVNKK